MTSFSHTELRRLEEVAQNASRAERGLMIDGWALGLSEGLAKRSRCINPFYPSAHSFAVNLAAAQAAFKAANLPCMFRLSPLVFDEALDHRLERLGYVKFDDARVQAVRLVDVPWENFRANAYRIHTEHDLIKAAEMAGAARGDTEAQIAGLARRWCVNAAEVRPMFAFAADGECAARCVSVLDDGWLGLFDIGTLPDYRRQGYAAALIEAQLLMAKAAGAYSAYLQVSPTNPAQTLYAAYGFKTVYDYWYRALPEDAH